LSIDHPVWHLVDDVRTGRSGGQVLLSQLRASAGEAIDAIQNEGEAF